MRFIARTCWKIVEVGGWAPLLVFATHLFIGRVLNAYAWWPPIDIPMHLSGGIAIAFFISRCFQVLPRQPVPHSRLSILELLLVGSLTATVAVFWEFAEFTLDQIYGTKIQVSLANTMRDLAMGISGAILVMMVRALQLRAGAKDLKEITLEWVRGGAAPGRA